MENSKRNRDHSGGFRTIPIVIIRAYQKALSPIFPSSCIYTPTCSHYAVNAIRKYGVLKGGFLSLKRILRCTPFHKGGYDPVP